MQARRADYPLSPFDNGTSSSYSRNNANALVGLPLPLGIRATVLPQHLDDYRGSDVGIKLRFGITHVDRDFQEFSACNEYEIIALREHRRRCLQTYFLLQCCLL